MINQFTDGIKAVAMAPINAAADIAKGVGNFLGFHSPTKEGAGADSDTWAPNLMKMFADGLTGSAPAVLAAANSVASGLRSSLAGFGGGQLSLSTSQVAMSGGVANPQGGGSRTPSITNNSRGGSTVNLNFGGVNISNGVDAEKFMRTLEKRLARVIQLESLGSVS